MWKDIRKIVGKLLLLLFPFFVILPVFLYIFRFYYLDEEYAMYRQQYDFVCNREVNALGVGKEIKEKSGEAALAKETTNTETANKEAANIEAGNNPSLLIIGDSRTKAAFDPALLGHDSYNLALGGTTPIEGYYTLKEYLENHEKPSKVILAYAPMHYTDVDTLWTRCIYFHTLSSENFKDLCKTSRNFEDTEHILIPHYNREYEMYKLWMPNKYATAVKNALFSDRHEKCVTKYSDMVSQKGHTFYGMEEYSDGINGEAKVSDFAANTVITFYLEKCITLCRDKGIELAIDQTPMNQTSYGILTPEFKEHFRQYMLSIAQKYPDISIYTDFYCYPNECFGDADHLNPNGSETYCNQILQKYY